MSQLAHLPQSLLDMLLGRLIPLFLAAAKNNVEQASQTAEILLAGHDPRTPTELALAADIVSFQAHALEALAYAANPDLSLNKILRLRGGAVSLSREAHKAQRRLDQIKAAQPQPRPQPEFRPEAEAEAPHPADPNPKLEKAMALIHAMRDAMQPAANQQPQTRTQNDQKRQLAARIAENGRKNKAAHLAQTSEPLAATA
jgi:hypothetical protein